MNARAWAVWSAAALVMVLSSTNPMYRALVLLVALNALFALRHPGTALRPLLIAVAVAAAVAVLFNVLLSHTGVHVLFVVPPQLPGVGGPVTAESIVYGLDVALGIAAAVLSVAPLSRVLHPHDLLDAFPRPLQRTAALAGAAVNIVPSVARNALAISEAQRMRGSAGTRLRDWPAVAAPVVLSALDDSLQLAEAMESRAFGSGPRTRYTTARFDLPAAAVVACSIAAIGLTIAARVGGGLPDWYPFPVVSMPDLSVLPAIACVLLATPLVAWRTS